MFESNFKFGFSPFFTTGIISREANSNTFRITMLNTSNRTRRFALRFYDWTDGTPSLVSSENIILQGNEGRVVDIVTFESLYDDNINFELFELQIIPYIEAVKFNFYQINTPV